MAIKEFFKKAFSDMKESAAAQHEVDKANFEAVKAESKANFQEAKANSNPEVYKKKAAEERETQIAEANERKAAAEERIEKAKNQ